MHQLFRRFNPQLQEMMRLAVLQRRALPAIASLGVNNNYRDRSLSVNNYYKLSTRSTKALHEALPDALPETLLQALY